MDFKTAQENLIKLLCCSIESLPKEKLKLLVFKRYKKWHPDKNKDNPDKYRELFVLLNTSYNRYLKGETPEDSGQFSEEPEYSPGFTADDLFCDEEWSPDFESDSDSDYNSTPFDDEFFNASPKKKFAVPEELRLFFRSKTNRRAGKLFMIFCFRDLLARKCLDKLTTDNCVKSFVCFAARTNKDIYCNLLITNFEQRLMDIKKLCRKNSLDVEVFYAVNQFKLIDRLYELYQKEEFQFGETIERKIKEANHFNNRQLVEFALSHELCDVFTLMYEYAHLADPCDRPEETKDHEDDHTNEVINARIFINLPDRKRVCKNAVDCVVAKLYTQLKLINNLKWLENRSLELSNKLIQVEDPTIFGEAYYYWKYCLTPEFFSNIMGFVVGVFTNCEHQSLKDGKRRYIALVGPYNCGKTTFAAAVNRFFEGVNININIHKERLPFYLGAAIGKRFVLFDDVKGYHPLMDGLPTGQGLNNLDDMRDHLDGIIDVQLEKKNQNPVNQRFPSGIITMNLYKIPTSLKVRLNCLRFPPSALYKKHKFRITMDTIFIAMAMDNLIPCDKDFIAHIFEKKDQWLRKHRQDCSCLNVSTFLLWVEYVLL